MFSYIVVITDSIFLLSLELIALLLYNSMIYNCAWSDLQISEEKYKNAKFATAGLYTDIVFIFELAQNKSSHFSNLSSFGIR